VAGSGGGEHGESDNQRVDREAGGGRRREWESHDGTLQTPAIAPVNVG
jgi:hypothetical protein